MKRQTMVMIPLLVLSFPVVVHASDMEGIGLFIINAPVFLYVLIVAIVVLVLKLRRKIEDRSMVMAIRMFAGLGTALWLGGFLMSIGKHFAEFVAMHFAMFLLLAFSWIVPGRIEKET